MERRKPVKNAIFALHGEFRFYRFSISVNGFRAFRFQKK